MKISSDLNDNRINSRNMLVELTIDEYLKIAREIVHKNEFQRRRVSSSKTVYSLLRSDLERGCIIPPVVLALTSEPENEEQTDASFSAFIIENKDHLVILDGLQRTYTMMDLVDKLTAEGDEVTLNSVLANIIRAEFYVGLNRLGILYRMLTLNTGQSPMSLRHQIEILYLDYLQTPIEGIELLRESDGQRAVTLSQYSFRDVVEGFNSYLDRDELPLDKANLLENIKSLEKLANENQDTDLFEGYLKSWNSFIIKINELCSDTGVSEGFNEQYGTPFGNTAMQVFKKAQAMAGFGAAIGKLKDFEVLNDSFDQVIELIKGIEIENPGDFLDAINRSLLYIKDNTKKIGNAQRSFFHFFFRGLFNESDDGFKNPLICAEAALKKFQAQNM